MHNDFCDRNFRKNHYTLVYFPNLISKIQNALYATVVPNLLSSVQGFPSELRLTGL